MAMDNLATIEMIMASVESNLPTYVAVSSAFAAVVATLVTAFVAAANFRNTKRKTGAEAQSQEATAAKINAEVPFQGGSYIRELSEAASSLVIPLRNENEKLLERVRQLEERVNTLEDKEQEARRLLHREREIAAMAKDSFDRQLRELSAAYQGEIDGLKTEVAQLEDQIGRAGGSDLGSASP